MKTLKDICDAYIINLTLITYIFITLKLMYKISKTVAAIDKCELIINIVFGIKYFVTYFPTFYFECFLKYGKD